MTEKENESLKRSQMKYDLKCKENLLKEAIIAANEVVCLGNNPKLSPKVEILAQSQQKILTALHSDFICASSDYVTFLQEFAKKQDMDVKPFYFQEIESVKENRVSITNYSHVVSSKLNELFSGKQNNK